MRLRGSSRVEEANGFLREHYVAEFNRRFQVAARQRGTAFPRCARRDLERVFSVQSERTVNRDNTVTLQNLVLQIEPVGWRATLAGGNVIVHQHLDGSLSISYGPHRWGRYTRLGEPLAPTSNAGGGKAAGWKSPEADFLGRLGNPATRAGFPLSHCYDYGYMRKNKTKKPDISLAIKSGHFHLLRTGLKLP